LQSDCSTFICEFLNTWLTLKFNFAITVSIYWSFLSQIKVIANGNRKLIGVKNYSVFFCYLKFNHYLNNVRIKPLAKR